MRYGAFKMFNHQKRNKASSENTSSKNRLRHIREVDMKKFAVVLPAGGLGKRMGTSIPKQLLDLGGKPVYRYSLETFASLPQITEVVLAIPADWQSHFEKDLQDFSFAQKLKIVVGGKERWQSVQNGIAALSPEVEFVLVHDVARPLISKELIEQVFKTLEDKGACLVARPSTDTVKVVENGKVIRTIPREKIFLAQTPQAAAVSTFRELYQKMEKKLLHFVPTDEASILEHYSIPVHIVPGNSLNDKLTTLSDLEKFRALLGK